MCEIFARQDPRRYQPVTRKLRLNGQSTSIRLERAFWDILDRIAAEEGRTTPGFLSALQSEVLEQGGEPANFTSLLRCACLVQLELQGSGGARMRDAARRVAGIAPAAQPGARPGTQTGPQTAPQDAAMEIAAS